jgi:hypothetical protein
VNLDTDRRDQKEQSGTVSSLWREGYTMKKSVERQTHFLLQISAELKNRMTEIQKLRELVQSAEVAASGQEAIRPAVPQRVGNELRV